MSVMQLLKSQKTVQKSKQILTECYECMSEITRIEEDQL